jgi:hypothetical protein
MRRISTCGRSLTIMRRVKKIWSATNLWLIFICVASIAVEGQSLKSGEAPNLVAFRWNSPSIRPDSGKVERLLQIFNWRLSTSAYLERNQILLIEPVDDKAAGRIARVTQAIIRRFRGLEQLSIRKFPSETRIFTGEVIVYLRLGASTRNWVKAIRKRGFKILGEPNDGGDLRYVVKKPGVTVERVVAELTNLIQVETAEPHSIILRSMDVMR